MKTYTATIMAQTVVPTTDAPIVLEVEADHPLAAVRSVAQRVAAAYYGEKGIASHIAPVGDAYLAAIGEFECDGEGYGVCHGVTLRITIKEDEARAAVLNARLSLVRKGQDMAEINRSFPRLDRALACDRDGNPQWRDGPSEPEIERSQASIRALFASAGVNLDEEIDK